MAMDTARPPEILKLHSDMVLELEKLFSLTGKDWYIILNQVETNDLLSPADVSGIKSMGGLFILLMKKKDSGITYGKYTGIREILGSQNVRAEEIIDHYTTRIHEFYKDVPEFEPTEKCFTTKVGNSAILKCRIVKSKIAITNVQWKRKAKDSDAFTDISIDNDIYTGGSPESPSLGITKTREEDDGAIYVCHATNAAGRGKSDGIQLIILPEKETIWEMWENISRQMETEAEPFVKPFGLITDSRLKLDLELDIREINEEFAANNAIEDVEKLTEILQLQIACRCGLDGRAINIRVFKGSIIVSFDITGATNLLQPSALALAERFSTGLKDGSIVLHDESGNPLEIQHDSIKITIKQTMEAATDMNNPAVSIDQAAYCIETGDTAILTCRLLTSTPISSVTWFRINEDGTEHPIAIDNEKYFGASVVSPSLAIDHITVADEGHYVCYAESSFGVGRSFPTSICTFSSVPRPDYMMLNPTDGSSDAETSASPPTKKLKIEGDTYPDNCKFVGRALIVNNYKFNGDPSIRGSKWASRSGSEVDVDEISALLKELRFTEENITVKRNLTKRELKKEIEEAAKKDYNDFSCFVCVIMSFGEPGVIICPGEGKQPDERCEIKDLQSPFTGDKCDSLKTKPKIYFIMGNNNYLEKHAAEGGQPRKENVIKETRKIPGECNFVTQYSSETDQGFWGRKIPKPSTYIAAVVEAFRTYVVKAPKGEDMDLLKVFTRINGIMANKNAEVPLVTSLLTKGFHFRPKV